MAAVQLQNPLCRVVEEVAVVGDGHHGAGEAQQELFQPVDRFRIQMVGRLVEQQHVGFRQQQLAQCHAALFTTGQHADGGVPWRQAQRVGGHFQLQIQIAAVGSRDDRFQACLFRGQGVEIGVFLGIRGVHGFQLGLRFKHFAQARFDFLAHGFCRVQLRFLRQVADVQARHRHGFALDVGVDACHDFQQGRFAGAVQAQHADLRAWEEGEGNIFQNLTLGRDDFAHAIHGVDVICH
ncbi:hypothetical protein D3C85_140940 [compost metagenome]